MSNRFYRNFFKSISGAAFIVAAVLVYLIGSGYAHHPVHLLLMACTLTSALLALSLKSLARSNVYHFRMREDVLSQHMPYLMADARSPHYPK